MSGMGSIDSTQYQMPPLPAPFSKMRMLNPCFRSLPGSQIEVGFLVKVARHLFSIQIDLK